MQFNTLFQTTCLTLFAMAVGSSGIAQDADPLTADEVVARVNARDEGEQVTRQLKMIMTDRRGQVRERDTFGFRKYYGDEKRTVIYFLSPSNIKDTGFLTFDYPDANVDDDQWLYLPAARKVRRISASDRGDYFLGTDFTYEDMKKESKISEDDYTFELLGEVEVDGHLCHHLRATPVDQKTARELGYGKVESWIDTGIYMVRKSEFWDVRGNHLKTLHVTDIEKVDGIWTAMRMEIENHKTDHKTLFEFTDVDYASQVNDNVFSQPALRRGAPR